MAKILIIDDDRDTMRILEAKLTDIGHQILQAVNGVEGLDKARLTHPDLILLDVMMPELDGLTVLQHLKFEPGTEKIPVVIMTAKGEKMQHVFKMEGAMAYITKPFVFSELLGEVKKCLGKPVSPAE